MKFRQATFHHRNPEIAARNWLGRLVRVLSERPYQGLKPVVDLFVGQPGLDLSSALDRSNDSVSINALQRRLVPAMQGS